MTTEERLARLEAAVLKFAEELNCPWVDARVRAHAVTLAETLRPAPADRRPSFWEDDREKIQG